MLSKFFNRKSFLATAVLSLVIAVFSLVIFPLPGVALPSKSIMKTYYSNASKTEIVGRYFLGCTGGGRLIGRETPYYITEDLPCNGGGSPRDTSLSCEFLASGCPRLPVF